MAKTVSAYEARTKFGEILNLVYYQNIEIIVEKMGKPLVKIVKVSPLSFEEKIAKYAGIWKTDKDIKKIESAMKKFRKNFKFTRF
ncbi:hypothetical protein A2781_05090 [Candidatus Gottesmanbacteria bacterium RIFCSPHIGHO2_01_FULL_42_27]|nr:MAG: hypothetical protein A2781_05090 [Candidatus Gottesmanbacteria bacterium RIFCSPHIGHO2_01_FULL_42_27]